MIKNRLARRFLRVEFRAVYAVGHSLEVPLGRETAALLVVGAGGVLSHGTAAALHRLTPRSDEVTHVTTRPSCRARSRPGLTIHQTRSLFATDVTLHRGLPVTSPARTLLDQAETVSVRELERELDEGLQRQLVTPEQIEAAVARYPGRRGAPVLVGLLDPARAKGITRSAAEERMLTLIRDANLPDPERNVAIGPYEVDFLWRSQRLAVEVDSYAWHSGPTAFKRDRRKGAFLTDQRLELLRVTWEMMDRPLELIARIARRL